MESTIVHVWLVKIRRKEFFNDGASPTLEVPASQNVYKRLQQRLERPDAMDFEWSRFKWEPQRFR